MVSDPPSSVCGVGVGVSRDGAAATPGGDGARATAACSGATCVTERGPAEHGDAGGDSRSSAARLSSSEGDEESCSSESSSEDSCSPESASSS